MPNSLVPGEITGTGSKSGAQGLKTWRAQMVKRGYSLTVDGRYGDATEDGAKNLQRLAGLAQAGKICPSTSYAAWLLPAVSGHALLSGPSPPAEGLQWPGGRRLGT